MFDLSTEAMQPQVQSKLGTELDKLWQSVIEYRDTKLTDVTKFQNRFLAIKNFFEKNIAKKVQDLVWKYVGINIKEISYPNPWDGGFANWIRIAYENDPEGNDAGSISNILSGGWEAKYWGIELPNSMKAADLIAIASSYNKLTGSINAQQRELVKKYVSSVLYFDIGVGFLLEDFLPKNSGVEYMKPREITSIILHEIGHSVTIIEHACDKYAQISSYNYLFGIYEARRSADIKEIATFARQVADFSDKHNRKDAAKKIRSVVNKFELDVVQAGNAADPRTLRSISFGLLESAGMILLDVIMATFDVLSFDSNGRFDSNDQKFKTSDIPVNSRMLTKQERSADEYALSHGYGTDLASALNKMDKWISRLGLTKEQCNSLTTAERIGKDISLFDKIKLSIFSVGLCSGFEYSLYPDNKKRLQEMLNVTLQSMKNNGASADVVRKFMKDVEVYQKHINECDKSMMFMARVAKAYDVFMSYVSIPSLVDMLVHGRIRRELENLIEDLQVLSGNMIGYYGLKLQQLANKG